MTRRELQIQVFLQLFLLFTGMYLIGWNIWKLNSGIWDDGIFEFYNHEVPIFKVSAGLLAGTISLIASWSLWIRVAWAHGFTILLTGFLFSYNLISLGETLSDAPYHAIPLVIILIVLLQSLPFLLRNSSRF